MDISLSPQVVFSLTESLRVTSGHMAFFAITLLIALWSVYIGRTAKIIPGSGQIIIEGLITWFGDLIQSAFKNKKVARRILPIIVTFFIVTLVSNIFGLFPLISSVVLESDSVGEASQKLFSTPTAHFSLTIALTLIALFISHGIALSIKPFKYIGNYIRVASLFKIRSFKDIPFALLDIFLGFLDLVGEVSKLISLSARLFGNVLSGELVAIVIMGLSAYTQFFVPIPFIVLATFSGIIQAMVFALLSLQYMSLAVSSIEDGDSV